jgi:HEAT repeat protein
MKRWFLWFITVLIFESTTIYAQENTEQYLQNIKGPKVEDFIKLIYEGSREDQLIAIDLLAKSGSKDDRVIEALLYCLQEGTFFIKRRAGTVINDFWDVRARSAEVLGDIGDPCVLPQLHKVLMRDPDPIVRSCAANAIGKIGQPESIRFLDRAIKTTDITGSNEVVILSCVNAMGEIGDPAAFLPLYEVTRGRYKSNIKLAARDALEKLHWE